MEIALLLVLLVSAVLASLVFRLKSRVDALSGLRVGDLRQQTDTHLLAGDAHHASKNLSSRVELLEKHVGRLRKRLGEKD